MEDASGEDLDWFWRGWFYSIDVCDISIDSVKHFKADLSAAAPKVADSVVMRRVDRPLLNAFEDISKIRNREDKNLKFFTDTDTTLRDFYWKYSRGLISIDTNAAPVPVIEAIQQADDSMKANFSDKHFYEVHFSNKGGLVMPVIVEWTYADSTKEVDRIPAQVWRKDESAVSKVFMKKKQVVSVRLDPMRETADINVQNNSWPKVDAPSRFTMFKLKQQTTRGLSPANNPMQKARQEAKKGF